MNITPTPYCKHCRFYHGANYVVCALHPYGPDSKTCSDYASKVSFLNPDQIARKYWNIRQFHDWKGWQKMLMLGLLIGSLGLCLLGWLVAHPPESTTETPAKVGGSDRPPA